MSTAKSPLARSAKRSTTDRANADADGDQRLRLDRVHLHAVWVAPRAVLRTEPASAAAHATAAMKHAANVMTRRMAHVPAAVDGHLWTDLSRSASDELAATIGKPANLTIHPQEDLDDLVGTVETPEVRHLIASTLDHRFCVNVGILADQTKNVIGSLYSTRGLRPDAEVDRRAEPRSAWKRVKGIFKSNPPVAERDPDEVNLVLDIATTEETLKADPLPVTSPVRIPKRVLRAGSTFGPGAVAFRSIAPGHPKNLEVLRLLHAGLTAGSDELPDKFASKRDRKLQARARDTLDNSTRAVALFMHEGTQDRATDHASRLRFMEVAERIRRNRPWFEQALAQAVAQGDEARAQTIAFVFDASWRFIADMAISLARPLELGSDTSLGSLRTVAKFNGLSKMVFNCPPPFVLTGGWIGEPLAPERWRGADAQGASAIRAAKELLARFDETFPGLASRLADEPPDASDDRTHGDASVGSTG